MSIRDLIRSAEDTEREEYEVPEWGVTVLLVTMSAKQRADIYTAMSGQSEGEVPLEQFWRSVLLGCVRDPEDRSPIFTEDDIDWVLSEKNPDVIQRLSDAALRVSGMDAEAQDRLGKDS